MVSQDSKVSAEEQLQESSTVQTLVRVRVRPLSSKEKGKSCLKLVDQHQDDDNCTNCGGSVAFLGTHGTASSAASYEFDRVYGASLRLTSMNAGESCSQALIFKDLAFVVDATLAGYNGTVLAYGQTGSGKTHTLFVSVLIRTKGLFLSLASPYKGWGSIEDQKHAGIVPRAVQHLGRGIAKATADQGAVFRVSIEG
eukprot:1157866-Pelagomonas_calceolata.AAC.8